MCYAPLSVGAGSGPEIDKHLEYRDEGHPTESLQIKQQF